MLCELTTLCAVEVDSRGKVIQLNLIHFVAITVTENALCRTQMYTYAMNVLWIFHYIYIIDNFTQFEWPSNYN